MAMEDKAPIHDILGHAVGWILGVFYTYDGLLRSRDPEWKQGALNFLIGLFRRIGLEANIAKSKTTTCQQQEIRLGMSEEVICWCSIGEGEN